MDNLTFFKQFIVFILLLFVSILSSAQSITGRVTDNEGNAIEFANVVLCADSDSAIISGCTSDEKGNFTLECADKNSKHLQVSFVGYERKVLSLQDTPISVVLEPIAMDEVVIEGHKKIYSMEKGAIVANVKGTILESFPRANDVIARLPFVKGKDGDFTIFGKGTPQIYINNRLVRDKEELEKLSSSEIESIKVITTPGAKYDASVKAVIQIKTYKPQGEGLSGILETYGRRSKTWAFYEYSSLNYRKGAWDIFGSFFTYQGNESISNENYYNLFINDTKYDITYKELQKWKSRPISVNGGGNFNPNQNHSAGLRYKYNTSNDKIVRNDEMSYVDINVLQSVLQNGYFKQPTYKHSINAYYNGSWNDKYSLNVNMDWYKGKSENKGNTSFMDNYADEINTLGIQKYDLYAIKGVFTYTNKWLTLDGGAEYAYTNVQQNYTIDNTNLRIDNSDDRTKQNRWALFVSAVSEISDSWEFGVGLRYENIYFDYYEDNILIQEQSKKYHKLFPNVQVSYDNDDFTWSLEYERKIQYPTYSELRSNVAYINLFHYESGNPLLEPQIQNEFTSMLGYKNLQFIVEYGLYENYIIDLQRLYKNKPIILSVIDNMQNIVHASSVGINYSPTIKWWRPSFEAGVDMQFLVLEGQKYNKPMFYTEWDNVFVLPKQWLINLDFNWGSKGHEDIYLFEPSWEMKAKIIKRFFDNNLTVSLNANDIFHTNQQIGSFHNHVMYTRLVHKENTRYLALTIEYKFNNTNSKYKGTSASNESQRL